MVNQEVSILLGMACRYMPGFGEAVEKPTPHSMRAETREELERQRKELGGNKKASNGAQYQVYSMEYTERVGSGDGNNHTR